LTGAALVLAVVPLQVWDFSADGQGLVSEGNTLQWAWSATPAAGPGDPSWGTNPDGQYLHDADDSLRLSPPGLAALQSPTLVIDHAYDVAAGDRAVVEADAGTGWVELSPLGGYPDAADGFVGASGGWIEHSFDLSGLGDDVDLRFRIVSDASVADDGWYLRRLELYDGDVTPPDLEAVQTPSDTQAVGEPQRVAIEITDAVAVVDPTLWWHTDHDPTERALPMVAVDGVAGLSGAYEAMIPGVEADTTVSWYATASDGEQVASLPEEGLESYRVFLGAPTGLTFDGTEPRVATEVAIRWLPPDSPHPVEGYEVWQDDALVASAVDTEVVAPIDAGAGRGLTVVADYGGLGVGDPSSPLVLTAEVPELDSVAPSSAWAGSAIWATVSVSGLYLLDGSTEVSLGEGVEVQAAEVLDAESALWLLSIDAEATPGPRELYVSTPQGDARFPEAFEVLDPSGRPQIVEVTPATVQQGAEVQLEVRASDPFATPAVVAGTDDLVVTSAAEPGDSDDTLVVSVAARRSAALGDHTLLVDDGVRLWEVVIEVTEYRVPPQQTCAVAPRIGAWAVSMWWAVAVVVVRRRRS